MISLCMIVKDEEAFLAQCLQSVKALADEIIIGDTGSKDSSREVARPFATKVVNIPWEQDFSKARNAILAQATREWILVLDADETINPKDHARIRELVSRPNDAYTLIQRNYTNDSSVLGWVSAAHDPYPESRQFSGWLPNPIVRLFRNDQRIRFKDPVHEQVGASLHAMQAKVEAADIPIHHFSQLKSAQQKAQKGDMYMQIGRQKLAAQDSRSYYEMGVQHQELQQYAQAAEYFKKAITIQPAHLKSYINWAACLGKLDQLSKAKRVLRLGLRIRDDPAIYNNLGILFAQEARHEEAVLLFQKAIELSPGYASAYYNLGLSCDSLQRYASAKDAFQKAVSLNPEYKKKIGLEPAGL
ncbi:MAG TPA: glycosyltransferase [Candidatus Nanoarchaeia archaeon]|nr:glycosyltransferase [Candidatus Nanoarchaeia archaeon]